MMGRLQPGEILTVELTAFDTMALSAMTRHLVNELGFQPGDEAFLCMEQVSAACSRTLVGEGLYQAADGAWQDRPDA
tara:strand:- start:860 stop:1090 length:231 start_codon:yes stop_codon:yes gene_type:complete